MEGRYALLLLAVLTASAQNTNFECKYDDGNGGDWMVAYKFPQDESTAFMAPRISWKSSSMEADSPIGRTLNQYIDLSASGGPVMSEKEAVGIIAYNQHPPSGVMVASLPGRGVLMVPDGTGIWIVHTFPQFPNLEDDATYEKPKRSNKAGMFVCVKISTAFNSIVEMLTYEAPLIYFLKKPTGTNNNWPKKNVEDLEKGSAFRVTPYAKYLDLKMSSLTLKAFAKLPQANLGDRPDFIKKSLRIWGQGDVRYKLPNYCNAFYKVEVLYGEFTLLNKKISNQYDSTVWLVSKGGKVWCFSNSPRLRTYEQYGNGVLCLENAEIYSAFKTLADQTKSPHCPK
ncbi:Deoxyribonuclease (DNase) II [Trichuris trichiura]|uniref:Deoxyribonuclease (DNase) II n=1 Tax=Trichuris trichiura TaxID=36087 RepID=A0A077Z9A6_TRITR|nr:Deoxyribonuclease (DNase) II [Trichuris trichiura]